jgi:hypothetical protein
LSGLRCGAAEACIPALTLTGISEAEEPADGAVSEELVTSGVGTAAMGGLTTGSTTATIPTALAGVAMPKFCSSAFEGLSVFVAG